MQQILLTGIAILFFCLNSAEALLGADKKDSLIFNQVMTQLTADSHSTTAQRVVQAAKLLLGTPYVAGTLEKEPEQLLINLQQTDCILFVETCLALALTSRQERPTFEQFSSIIRNLRYRNGQIEGYTSRLHYTSEWILQGEQRGVLKEVSREMTGIPFKKTFFFMSTHPQSYKQLANAPAEVEKIKQTERQLNRYTYFYLPKDQVASYAGLITEGDILGFCTTIEGLDMTHVGIAYRENGKLTFIHASSSEKKVVIERAGLLEYITPIRSNSGIRVIRPL